MSLVNSVPQNWFASSHMHFHDFLFVRYQGSSGRNSPRPLADVFCHAANATPGKHFIYCCRGGCNQKMHILPLLVPSSGLPLLGSHTSTTLSHSRRHLTINDVPSWSHKSCLETASASGPTDPMHRLFRQRARKGPSVYLFRYWRTTLSHRPNYGNSGKSRGYELKQHWERSYELVNLSQNGYKRKPFRKTQN